MPVKSRRDFIKISGVGSIFFMGLPKIFSGKILQMHPDPLLFQPGRMEFLQILLHGKYFPKAEERSMLLKPECEYRKLIQKSPLLVMVACRIVTGKSLSMLVSWMKIRVVVLLHF